jgi:two-component system NtrC family sensor kinase
MTIITKGTRPHRFRLDQQLKSCLLHRQKAGVGDEYLKSSHDITQRKQDELTLRELHAQLLQNEKMASIGQLSAGIAHEINNPMGFINSNLTTLKKYIEKFERYIHELELLAQQSGSTEQQQGILTLKKNLKLEYVLHDVHQLLHESTEGAERVMKIVQDLKTFSRSDTSKIGKADINECLDSTINIIRNKIKYAAELVKDYAELPTVQCNIQQLNQVFLNLLINATHAIEDKGLEELGIITIKTRIDADTVLIAVSDTGCGIPADSLNKIFDPFFTTKDVGKGTGLGLSISHEIIKKHGGELTVESTVGQGTTFTVRLPLVSPTDIHELITNS